MGHLQKASALWLRYTQRDVSLKKVTTLLLLVTFFHFLFGRFLELVPPASKTSTETVAQKEPIKVRFEESETQTPRGKPGKQAQPKSSGANVNRLPERQPQVSEYRPMQQNNAKRNESSRSEKSFETLKSPTLEPLAPPVAKDAPSQKIPPSVGPSLVSPKFRNFLPDSNYAYSSHQQSLGQKANEDVVGEGNEDGSAAIDINTREYKYASYFDGVIRQIENVWVYPNDALRSGLQGQAVYVIVINRDGSLRKVIRESTSGFTSLDREVERAVQMAGPYNPVPSRIDKDPLVVRIRFTYTLTRFGIF